MSRSEEINKLISRNQQASSGAKQRLEGLFDAYSFVELGRFNEKAGVVTGYGTIEGRLVYAYSQEGEVNALHAKKIGDLYALALKMGAPVVGIMSSNGVALGDGIDAFESYGTIFSNQVKASGVIPQISLVLGDCMGVATAGVALSDFVVMTEKNSKMFMMSPSTFPGSAGRTMSGEDLGGGLAQGKRGAAHLVCADEAACFESARKLIGFLPDNNLDGGSSIESNDDLNRIDESLNSIVPEDDKKEIDVKSIISSIADNNDFLEIQKDFASNMVVGFIRMDGICAGVVANNGVLDINACQKAADFVNFCDAFGISVVSLTDACGYEHTLEQEEGGIVKYAAKLMFAFANATVPKINVVLRNGIGNQYLFMNSKHIGADVSFAYPGARIALMGKDAATKVMNIDEASYNAQSDVYEVSAKGYIDEIIVPSETRKNILMALEMLSTKRELIYAKKHPSTKL